MTLTKSDIVDTVSNQSGLSKTKSAHFVQSVFEHIKASLESGQDVLLSGFGKFCVKGKASRKGRNPVTGDDLTLGARRVVTFRCSPSLRKKIDGES